MEKNSKKIAGVIGTITMIFLLGFVIAAMIYKSSDTGTLNALEAEKLKAEKLLSEKIQTEKEVKNLNDLMKELNWNMDKLEMQLNDANARIAAQESEVNKAKKDNSLLASLKKQVADFEKSQKDWEAKVKSLTADKESLTKKNDELNNALLTLKNENNELKDNIAMMSSLVANNLLVLATKGKHDKLTVKAKRTRTIQLTFDLPEQMAENVSFKITAPDGKIYKNGEKNIISYSIIEKDDNPAYASLIYLPEKTAKTKRVKMTFKPNDKLSKGIYSLDLMNDDVILGTLQIKLR